ncbi:MAG: hypothetical protein H6587_09790 [Flavobacteriales bacterium]|nr:hypothetical protein [Flavobacteriales bacterium]
MAIELKDFIVEVSMDENGQIIFIIKIKENNDFVLVPAEIVEETENGYKICFIYKEEKKCLTIKID